MAAQKRHKLIILAGVTLLLGTLALTAVYIPYRTLTTVRPIQSDTQLDQKIKEFKNVNRTSNSMWKNLDSSIKSSQHRDDSD